MTERPRNLIYGLNDRPLPGITFFLGFQHLCIIAIAFIFPVVIARSVNADQATTNHLVSMSMLAGGLGTILQVLNRWGIGSGYLCPQVCGPSFLSASLLAAKAGGLPLLMGMTVIAGLFEVLFSRIMHRLRVLFPPEVTGLIVAMVGLTVIRIAMDRFLGTPSQDGQIASEELFVAIGTLSVMVGLNVWSKGKIKLFCILIGMGFGYALSWLTGLLGTTEFSQVSALDWVELPFKSFSGFAFDWHLLIPFVVAALCSNLKTIGDITTCQKINDAKWVRPDMNNIKKGILADGLGCLSAGLLGGMGQSTSSTNIGLSLATGATSRVIALATGILLILLAFLPKIAAVFAIMPSPVMGATLIFALSFMIVAGFQIVMSRMLDARKTFVVGISMIVGLSVDIVPYAYQDLHPWMQPIFSSSLSAAAICAVFLNFIMRIGIGKRAELDIEQKQNVSNQVFQFLEEWGGHWAALPHVIKKASGAATECLEAISTCLEKEQDLKLIVTFDEFNLDLLVRYTGKVLPITKTRPDPMALLECEDGDLLLAGYMAGQLADKIETGKDGKGSYVRLHFDH